MAAERPTLSIKVTSKDSQAARVGIHALASIRPRRPNSGKNGAYPQAASPKTSG